MEEQIVTMLKFYGRINRPLTLLEIWRRSRNMAPMTLDVLNYKTPAPLSSRACSRDPDVLCIKRGPFAMLRTALLCRLPRSPEATSQWQSGKGEFCNSELDDIDKSLHGLIAEQKIVEYRGFFGIRNHSGENDLRATIVDRVFQDVCADEKWEKFILLRRIFRFLPFVEFVFASGSMAVGNAGPLSDFDVIVGARKGRIFTVRALCIAVFGLLRKRRKKFSHHDEANNKICLNHFVTRPAYRLSGPYNIYWEQLYKSLVPLAGNEKSARDFISANDWAHAEFALDRRFVPGGSIFAKFFETMCEGKKGDMLERILRAFQQHRITQGLRCVGSGRSSRITHTDEELEFHPDTARIEKMIEGI